MIDDATLLLRLRSRIAGLRLSAAMLRVALVLKANPYWHLRPRVPAGSPAGGQWTTVAAGPALPALVYLGRLALLRFSGALKRIYPALRRLPKGWSAQSRVPRDDEFDDETGRIGLPSWQREGNPIARFKNEREMRTWLGPAGPGREWHHIVEKRLAENGTFPADWIHNTDNIVSLPVEVHRRISAEMSTRGRDFGGDIRRYWVEKLPYGEQYDHGLALIRRMLEEEGYDPRDF